MTSVEQHTMVRRLNGVTTRMDAEERRKFEMMAKRDKDDEDFDAGTMASLKQMYAKYFPKHSKDSLEDAWKKLAGSKPTEG